MFEAAQLFGMFGIVVAAVLGPRIPGLGILGRNPISKVLWSFLEHTSSRDPFKEVEEAMERMATTIHTDRGNLEHLVDKFQHKSQQMRIILDNVVQGLVVVDTDGQMVGARSSALDQFLDDPDQSSLTAALRRWDPKSADALEMGLEEIKEGFMPLELLLVQLPEVWAGAGGRTLRACYLPLEQESVEHVLVMLSDVTEELAHQRASREREQTLNLLEYMLQDRAAVLDFVAESRVLVNTLQQGECDAKEAFRMVHTLKGNAGCFGLDHLGSLCHEIESGMVDSMQPPNDVEIAQIIGGWRKVENALKISSQTQDTIQLTERELQRLVARLRDAEVGEDLLLYAGSFGMIPIQSRLERLGEDAKRVARRLDKPPPHCIVHGSGVRLARGEWSEFLSSMVHVVRNAMDHGIEAAETRIACGKPEAGHLQLTAALDEEGLTISVIDDGGGIDWAKLRMLATQRGIPSESHSDLVDCLFHDGISTKAEVSSTSGRGVGMAAVKAACQSLGGRIYIDSVAGSGTTMRFVFEPVGPGGSARVWSPDPDSAPISPQRRQYA